MSYPWFFSETLLAGLMLTFFGISGCVMPGAFQRRRASWLLLFSGFAVMCAAAPTEFSGEILAVCVFAVGMLLTGIASLSRQTSTKYFSSDPS